MSRFQRERRQQAVIVTVFTALLLLALGLVAWAASERYYSANLAPVVSVDGKIVPMREWQRQLDYELVRFYQDYNVPQGFENDPNLLQQKASYERVALDRIIEHKILDAEAREAGFTPSAEELEKQYQVQFGEFKVRHILFGFDEEAEDKELDELNTAAAARAVRNELLAAPMDQDLWNRLAEQHSDDPGSQFSGGELGFASSGQYVTEFEDAIRTLEVGEISDLIRTQFGFHIIQVQEKRDPRDNELVKRYLSSGFTEADLRGQARYAALRREFEARAKATATASPTEQVHAAGILVNIPLPSTQSFEAFTTALQKQTDVRDALEKGTDFAEVAKQYSDDAATKDKGGDLGWIARGMMVDPKSEEVLFSTEVGKFDPTGVTVGTRWSVYKILEKDASRELTEDQKRQITERAYPYWLQRQRIAHGVDKHILEL